MRALGIVRKMDELGRIVVPIEVRRSLGWKMREPIEMFLDDDKLVMQSYTDVRKKQEMVEALKEVQEGTDDVEAYVKLEEVISYLEGKG